MKLTPAQLLLLRSRPHQTKLYVSVFQPVPIFKALINMAAPVRGERVIVYDSVSLGVYTVIEPGMTLLIGTSAGASDVGRIRIRSATNGTITVSENSNINWADNLFLTVLKYWELWPIFPRIISDPANAENVIFYKDYDVAYTTQNTVLGTFPNAGPHRAAFLDAGQASVYYSATGSSNLAGASLTYQWTFEGGTPASSTALTPGTVTYNTPGHYVTKLAISGSNGGIDTTYRYVSIYDRPGNGTGTIPLQYTIDNFGGSRAEGGYLATIKMHNPTGEIYDGAPVVIFAEDAYGGTNGSLGGNAPNASSIVMSGYIMKGSINWDYANSFVEFSIGSITAVMKDTIGFSISVESKASPAKWFELYDMNVKKAIYHYLRWHSTALNIADVQFLGTDYPIQFFDADRESLFDAIDNLMRGALMGEVVADRQSKIWCEISAEATPNSTGTFTQAMSLTSQDWMRQPTLDEAHRDVVSYIELGGIQYSGLTGTSAPLMAAAPGDAPGFRGTIERTQGLALADQTQINTLAGNLYAHRNAKYKSISMTLAGNYRNLDIAPQETVQINISPQDTVRRISLSQLYLPTSMQWSYDSANQFLYPDVTFEVVKGGLIGQTIVVPPIPADDGGFKVPKINIPSIPISIGTGIGAFATLTKWDAGAAGKFVGTGVTTDLLAGQDGGIEFPAPLIFETPPGVFIHPSSLVSSPQHTAYFDVPVAGVYRVSAVVRMTVDSSFPIIAADNVLVRIMTGLTTTFVNVGTDQAWYPFTMGDRVNIAVSELVYCPLGKALGINVKNNVSANRVSLTNATISIELIASL